MPGHVIIFFTKAWFVYLRIFIRRKIHRASQKPSPGHINKTQEYQCTRLFLLVIPVTITNLNLTCIKNAQKQEQEP